jgi:putative phosphoesterase
MQDERLVARQQPVGNPMRIAVIADIHGNMPALEAVLADVRHRDIDRTINLGDCVSGPLWPREVCDLLMASSSLVIRGNHDRWVSGPDPASIGPSDRYAYSNLGANHRHWLNALPTSADAGHGILACHGTPTNDNKYLVEEVSEGRLVRAPPSVIQERLGDVHARVVLCGHSHQQHLIQLPTGPLVLNPGSVGCPAYDDPGADPHLSESGSPYARYAVLSIDEQNVSADMIAVTYDWKAASARAEKNGRPEWAYGLRTGWFIPDRTGHS